uniref:Uncharacterized protein n=1 Tax=Panagrolaimus sp. ES5 TaxID=591445 RepID=A0AC34FJ74_9BILA
MFIFDQMGFFSVIGGAVAAVIVTPGVIVVAPVAAAANGLKYVLGQGDGLKNTTDVLTIPAKVYTQIAD